MRFFKKRPDWKKLNNEFKEAEKQLQIAKQKWFQGVIRIKDDEIQLLKQQRTMEFSPCTNP